MAGKAKTVDLWGVSHSFYNMGEFYTFLGKNSKEILGRNDDNLILFSYTKQFSLSSF